MSTRLPELVRTILPRKEEKDEGGPRSIIRPFYDVATPAKSNLVPNPFPNLIQNPDFNDRSKEEQAEEGKEFRTLFDLGPEPSPVPQNRPPRQTTGTTIPSGSIAAGTIKAAQIFAGAITSTKLATGKDEAFPRLKLSQPHQVYLQWRPRGIQAKKNTIRSIVGHNGQPDRISFELPPEHVATVSETVGAFIEQDNWYWAVNITACGALKRGWRRYHGTVSYPPTHGKPETYDEDLLDLTEELNADL